MSGMMLDFKDPKAQEVEPLLPDARVWQPLRPKRGRMVHQQVQRYRYDLRDRTILSDRLGCSTSGSQGSRLY